MGGTKGPQTEDDRRVFTEHLMEEEELQTPNKFPQSDTKFALRIIEYVWAHRMFDTLEVLDSSNWPEMESQPLSLEDSLRLRVGSAQAYSLVRSRNTEHFETVMDFLETTHRLLPRLVSPIKHMKIMFGLKTMLIMRMLKRNRGLVDIMFKINQLFPSKLPQYQDHCNQHQMFLMRKNHLDFKAFMQVLALEKDKLEDYVQNQMEDQYGEVYAQKVEERLLHYLLRLEAVLPEDTCVDKILKRGSPMTEEEKRLLKVVTSDSTIIVETLKKLLRCDVSSGPVWIFQSSESETGSSQNTESTSRSSNSWSRLVSVDAKSHRPETDTGVLKDSGLMKEDLKRSSLEEEESSDSGKAGTSQRSSEDVQRDASSPQFCSKHQRWVNNILQECPAECSEELQLQANVSSSPALFPSSSGSSSDDLTPSNLQLPPCNQQPPASHTPPRLQTSAQVSLIDQLESEGPGSGTRTSQSEPTSQRHTLQPGVLSPVVRLIDISSVDQFCSIFKSQQASLNCSQQAAPASRPQRRTSGGDVVDSSSNRPEALVPENPPNSTHETPTCRSAPPRRSSRVLKRSRPECASQSLDRVQHPAQTTSRSSPLLQTPPQREASISTPHSGSLIPLRSANRTPLSTGLLQHGILQNSEPLPQPHLSIPSETSTVHLKLSLCSQTMLLQSRLLQPSVSLVRLSRQECDRETERGSSTGDLEPVEQGSRGDNPVDRRMEEEGEEEGEGEDADSSFDVNFLFSSSSEGENEDSLHSDPHYRPNIKKKRLLMEYEAARSMNNM